MNISNKKTHRRGFLGTLATGAAAFGMATLANPFDLFAESDLPAEESPDAWLARIKGKHRMVFDIPEPQGIIPFAWARVFLMTNEKTGTPEKDCGVVMVLRHNAIPYAMGDELWTKYKLGEVFKIKDTKSNAPSLHNPFWKPKPGDFKIPGIGNVAIGINELRASGVMFCVCSMALTVLSATLAQNLNMDAAKVKKDWVAGILPGIQIVPSGLWALNRAQEHGCSYCKTS